MADDPGAMGVDRIREPDLDEPYPCVEVQGCQEERYQDVIFFMRKAAPHNRST